MQHRDKGHHNLQGVFTWNTSSMQKPRTEHDCPMCWSHRQNKMHRHEARGTDKTYALHCLLRPKTYYLKFVVSITAQYNIPQTGMNPKFRATLYVPYRSTLTAAEILRDAVQEGQDNELQIVLPDHFIQQSCISLPLEIASRIMRKHARMTTASRF